MFSEIGVLKVCNIYRKTPVLQSLFCKVWRPVTLLKRDFNTDLFL